MDTVIDEGRPGRLIGRASIVAAGTVYQQIISFLSGLIVARVIGASEYGIFNLARSLLDLTAIFTRLGLDIGLQRYFGETNASQDNSFRIAVLRRVRLMASALALITVAAVALGLGRYLEDNVYHYSHFAEILLCLALALPFFTDIAVLGGAYRGILKLSAPVIVECVLMPTVRLALILLLFAAGWRLWAVVAGTTMASLLASAFLASRARDDFRAHAPAPSDSWVNALQVVRYSSILALAVLATTLTGSMDMLILGRFATAQDLGQYSLVKMLLVLMGVFGVAFSQGLGALVAERHVRRDRAGIFRIDRERPNLIMGQTGTRAGPGGPRVRAPEDALGRAGIQGVRLRRGDRERGHETAVRTVAPPDFRRGIPRSGDDQESQQGEDGNESGHGASLLYPLRRDARSARGTEAGSE